MAIRPVAPIGHIGEEIRIDPELSPILGRTMPIFFMLNSTPGPPEIKARHKSRPHRTESVENIAFLYRHKHSPSVPVPLPGSKAIDGEKYRVVDSRKRRVGPRNDKYAKILAH